MRGASATLAVWQRIMSNAAMSADRMEGIVEIAQAVAGDGRTALIASWFSGRTMFGNHQYGVAQPCGSASFFVGYARDDQPDLNDGLAVSMSWCVR